MSKLGDADTLTGANPLIIPTYWFIVVHYAAAYFKHFDTSEVGTVSCLLTLAM